VRAVRMVLLERICGQNVPVTEVYSAPGDTGCDEL
jgi:hypothetical protein